MFIAPPPLHTSRSVRSAMLGAAWDYKHFTPPECVWRFSLLWSAYRVLGLTGNRDAGGVEEGSAEFFVCDVCRDRVYNLLCLR